MKHEKCYLCLRTRVTLVPGPYKNLGGVGDGGMITTHNGRLAEKLRRMREYGWHERYISRTPGTNSRLDELQAAVLRVK